MRSMVLLQSVVSVLACCSKVSADFIFTSENAGSGFWNFFVRNDGDNGTGSNIVSLTLNYSGSRTMFHVDDSDLDGTPDTVDLTNSRNVANVGWVRLGTASQTLILDGTPTTTTAQPNDWIGGVTHFRVVAATTAVVPANQTPNGRVFARLYFPDANPTGDIFGSIQGESGPAVTFGNPPPPVNLSPVVTANAGAEVTFTSDFNTPKPFTALVSVHDGDTAAQSLSLALGAIPNGLSNVQVTPSVMSNAGDFTVTGLAAWSSDVVYQLPVTISDDGSPVASTTAVISIRMIPEPATLAVIPGLGLLALRRRK